MTYLTTDDLTAFLDEQEIAAIKRDYETDGVNKLPVGIEYAENFAKDRLSFRYDLTKEYVKTGKDRSSTLLEVLAHIAIWKMTAVFPTVQLDGKRHYFYEQALENLDKVAKGQLLTSLPTLETGGVGIVYGTSIDTDVIY